jgi:lysophospholipase L1-like esterase
MRPLLTAPRHWLGLLGLVVAGLLLWAACVWPVGRGLGGAAPEWEAADAGSVNAPAADAGSAALAPPPSFPAYVVHPEDVAKVEVPIEGVERLDYYYGKLTLTDLGYAGAITRASHWGDSVLGGDGMTDAIRQLMQRRFGDAGHGFHAMGRYSPWYRHRGVRYEERRDWDTCLIIFKCKADMRYGYAGVASSSRGKALSHFQTMPAELGEKVSRFELWYQKRPDGGGFELRVDGQVERVVDGRAPELSDEVETLRVPDGQHEFDVAALGVGVAQAYGVVLERDGPGIVWDELSMIGSFTQRLDYQNAEHLAGQVRRRDVDLMVFILGGNDLMREKTDLKLSTERYEAEYTRVIRKFRAGKPQASCMIMALTDHAHRVNGAIVSRPIVGRLAAAQRKVAHAEGCAFYDTFKAMGGVGSVERWRQAKPPLTSPDLRHPTVAGQRRIAQMLYGALMKGYAEYRQRQEGQPLPLAPGQEPSKEAIQSPEAVGG